MHHLASPSCWLLWNSSNSKSLLISQSFESIKATMGVEVGLKCKVPSVWLEWKAPKRFPDLPESSENRSRTMCSMLSLLPQHISQRKKAVFIQSVWLFPALHTAFPELHILCIVENNLFMEYYCVGRLLDRQAFGDSFSKHHCYAIWPGTRDTKRPKI